MKHGVSGENILLVGNDDEKRISIMKAMLICANHYGYKVKVFASKSCQFYRQNKGFFDTIASKSNNEVITSFPEICKHIGVIANQLKSLYSDDDSCDLDQAWVKKELDVFVGLDDMYLQMESSSLTQKQAWAVADTRQAEVTTANTTANNMTSSAKSTSASTQTAQTSDPRLAQSK